MWSSGVDGLCLLSDVPSLVPRCSFLCYRCVILFCYWKPSGRTLLTLAAGVAVQCQAAARIFVEGECLLQRRANVVGVLFFNTGRP